MLILFGRFIFTSIYLKASAFQIIFLGRAAPLEASQCSRRPLQAFKSSFAFSKLKCICGCFHSWKPMKALLRGLYPKFLFLALCIFVPFPIALIGIIKLNYYSFESKKNFHTLMSQVNIIVSSQEKYFIFRWSIFMNLNDNGNLKFQINLEVFDENLLFVITPQTLQRIFKCFILKKFVILFSLSTHPYGYIVLLLPAHYIPIVRRICVL